MNGTPWIIIALLAGLIFTVLAVFVFKRYRKAGTEPDYKTFFIIGIIWIAFGIIPDNSIFFILGLVFLAIGLANKSKWKKQPKWSELSPQQRKYKIAIFAILSLLLLAGLAAWYSTAQ